MELNHPGPHARMNVYAVEMERGAHYCIAAMDEEDAATMALADENDNEYPDADGIICSGVMPLDEDHQRKFVMYHDGVKESLWDLATGMPRILVCLEAEDDL